MAYLASQPCHYLTPVQFGSFAAVAERRIEQLHLRLGELGLEAELRAVGIEPTISKSPEEFGAFIKSQAEVREKVIKAVGIKIE